MKEKLLTLDIPDEVHRICRSLNREGERAYVVGGALRDLLSGRTGRDFDLATTATPDKVIHLFDRVIPTGLKHGTVTVLLQGAKFEVTTLRGEGAYSDGRHPDTVEFLNDIDADLARRDFTVNAMAWDPILEVLHDPFDGETDLKAGILRAVGDPAERFEEDGLRVLRAARFVATLGFCIEEKTFLAMSRAAPALTKISAERQRDELTKLLSAEKPSTGLEVMERAGFLPFVSAELAALRKPESESIDAWQQTLVRVDAIPARLHLRLAALLLDIGDSKLALDRQGEATQLARQWLSKMRFDKKTTELVSHLIEKHLMSGYSGWSDAEVRRFIRNVGRGSVYDLMDLKRADILGHIDFKAELKDFEDLAERMRIIEQSNAPLCIQELALNGQDLMGALSLEPGHRIGNLLEAILEHVIDHPEDNQKDRLIKLARKLNSEIDCSNS
ncbi:MAG: polynucleotide adenylyltransferase [Proteobacteria bacterium]|nr:polynucleotide adenylyltransferase [Pseudomonadota bacterium]